MNAGPRLSPWSPTPTNRAALTAPFRWNTWTALAVGLIVLVACGQRTGSEQALRSENASGPAVRGLESGVAVPVEVDAVERGTLVLEVSATGQSVASRRAEIPARVEGRVVALPYEEGDRVPRGAVLARIDPREYALAVERAEAELEEARTRYREMTLFDDRIEDPVVREERAEAARARSGLARAEIAHREARLDLARTTLTAPFPGLVADVEASRGADAAAGETLLTVVDPDPIRVEVQVPESELRWVERGHGAAVHLPAFPDTTFHGTVTAINPTVEPESRTGRVTVSVPNPDGSVRPGMYARVTLEGRAFEDRILVPREAVIERDGRTLVFVFGPIAGGPPGEGLAKWVYVTTGRGNSETVALVEKEDTDPPEPGSLVIVGGNYTLVHDARVRIERP